MSERERLEKAVVGTKDSFDTAYAAEAVAWYAWDEAERELNEYLKEQQDHE